MNIIINIILIDRNINYSIEFNLIEISKPKFDMNII